ncbi:MAG: hypothetical protein ACR2PT_10520 [Endozoicomonas sp.]
MQGNATPGQSAVISLLLEEVEAMATHALGTGIHIPGGMIHRLETYRNSFNRLASPLPPEECQHPTAPAINTNELAEGLTQIHNELSRAIKPASPRAVLLLKKEENRRPALKVLGPVPLIRHVMIAALVFLVGFVSVSLSPQVNTKNIEAGLFASDGIPLLLNLLFLLCAAGLGACFAALFKANSYVISGTYEPRYEATYWARISLGLIAGLLLATLVPIAQEAGHDAKLLGKPLLALLGGFSAALLYRILNRLVSTVESFISGETKDLIRINEQNAKNKAEEEQIQTRVKTAQSLMKIQNKLTNGGEPTAISQDVASIIDEIMQSDMRQVDLKPLANSQNLEKQSGAA